MDSIIAGAMNFFVFSALLLLGVFAQNAHNGVDPDCKRNITEIIEVWSLYGTVEVFTHFRLVASPLRNTMPLPMTGLFWDFSVFLRKPREPQSFF